MSCPACLASLAEVQLLDTQDVRSEVVTLADAIHVDLDKAVAPPVIIAEPSETPTPSDAKVFYLGGLFFLAVLATL